MNVVQEAYSSFKLAALNLPQLLSNKQSLARMVQIYSGVFEWSTYLQIMTWYLPPLALIYIGFKYMIYPLYLDPINQLPGPGPELFPHFLGHLKQIGSKSGGDMFREWAAEYGSVFRFFLPGNKPFVFVSDTGLLKYILSSEEDKFCKPPGSKKFIFATLGDGLLLMDGDMHRNRRKVMQSAFGLQAVRKMVPKIIPPTQEFVQNWWKQCSSPTEINISDELGFLVMNVLGATLFEQKFDTMNNPGKKRAYLSLHEEVKGVTTMGSILGVVCPWVLKLPIPRLIRLRRYNAILNEEARAMVIEAAQQPDLDKRTDVLSILIKSIDPTTGQSLALDKLQGQCVEILAAGIETTNVSLSYAIFELARNQDLQDELRQEAQQLFQSSSPEDEHPTDMPNYDDIMKLPLLNNFFKETLRVWTPIAIGIKMALEDFTWNDRVFAKGTHFFTCASVNHLDKQHWGDDAEDFLPSRWDRAPAKNISPFVYLPFSSGAHNCIGYRQATIVFKVIMFTLIRNFKFTPKPGTEIPTSLSIVRKPIPGNFVFVERLD